MNNFEKVCLTSQLKALRLAMREGKRGINRAFPSLSSINRLLQDPRGPSRIRDNELEPLIAGVYMVVVRAEENAELCNLAKQTRETIETYIRRRELFT